MLFRAGLRSLGYRITSLQGRVVRGLAVDAPRPAIHMLLKALLGGIHVDKTGGMPELVVVVKRAIVDRPISGPQQIVGMTRAPAASTLRRTLHLF
jgi:hypothetical protein